MCQREAAVDFCTVLVHREQQGGAFHIMCVQRHVQKPDRQAATSFAFKKDAALVVHPHKIYE